jgi:hypothetical protein
MKSISACDGRGNAALVEAGSVLLGCPGAPGCTTTGVDAFACCARADAVKKPEQIVDARRNTVNNAGKMEPRSGLEPETCRLLHLYYVVGSKRLLPYLT